MCRIQLSSANKLQLVYEEGLYLCREPRFTWMVWSNTILLSHLSWLWKLNFTYYIFHIYLILCLLIHRIQNFEFRYMVMFANICKRSIYIIWQWNTLIWRMLKMNYNRKYAHELIKCLYTDIISFIIVLMYQHTSINTVIYFMQTIRQMCLYLLNFIVSN